MLTSDSDWILIWTQPILRTDHPSVTTYVNHEIVSVLCFITDLCFINITVDISNLSLNPNHQFDVQQLTNSTIIITIVTERQIIKLGTLVKTVNEMLTSSIWQVRAKPKSRFTKRSTIKVELMADWLHSPTKLTRTFEIFNIWD